MFYLQSKRKIIYVINISILFLSCIFPRLLPATPSVNHIKIGVLANRGSERAMTQWRPTAIYLTKMINEYKFSIIPLNFEEIKDSVRKKNIDFLIVNSEYYVLLEDAYGLSRIATMRNRFGEKGYQMFGAIIFTQAENQEINSLKDIINKSFMAVDPNSFGGWIMACYEFQKNNIDPKIDFKILKFGGTHDNVVMAVKNKKIDAGTVRTDTLERMSEEKKININDFKILNLKPMNNSFPFLRSTELYPEWPFAKLSHTSNKLAEQVILALLNMPAESPAAISANITGWTVPLDYSSVHHVMQELKIGPYQNLKTITLWGIIRKYYALFISISSMIFVMSGVIFYISFLNKQLKTTRSKLEKARDGLEIAVEERTRELVESEKKYRIVAENAYDWEYWLDPLGDFIYCSPSCIETTGYSNETFLSNKDLLFSIVHPDDMDFFKKHTPGNKNKFITEKIEFRIIDKSGKIHWIEHVCQSIYDNDKYLGIRASNRDITEKKNSDEKLCEQLHFQNFISAMSTEFLKLSPDILNDILKWLKKTIEFIHADLAILILFQNEEKILYTYHIISQDEFLHFINVEETLSRLNDQIKTGEPLILNWTPNDFPEGIDVSFFAKKGLNSIFISPLKAEEQLIGAIIYGCYNTDFYWSDIIISMLKLANEIFANALLKRNNVARNKLLQEQLYHTQKMEAIGVLTGGIAHDFNNILSTIFGFTEIAMLHLEKGWDLKSELKNIMQAAIRARNLIQHLLIFSRSKNITKEPLNIIALAKESLKFIRASLPSIIKITEEIPDRSYLIMAEPTQIHQVFINLFINAAHAMRDKGGTLSVKISESEIPAEKLQLLEGIKEGIYLEIVVSDTGHGIPEKIKNRIFEPFFTTKKEGEGTGMGLSIVHTIIKEMDGLIFVESEEGRGTTFRLILPICNLKNIKNVDEIYKPKPGVESILLVDDEEGIIQTSREMLENLGYHVITSSSSLEALELFKQKPDQFDLVITDLTMPSMTGIELTKKIKKIRLNIPVILCSGFSTTITKTDLDEIGINAMIMKPVICNELTRIIDEVLKK